MYTLKGYQIGASYYRKSNNELGYGCSIIFIKEGTHIEVFIVDEFAFETDFEVFTITF